MIAISFDLWQRRRCNDFKHPRCTGLVIVTLIDGEQVFTRERIDADAALSDPAFGCLHAVATGHLRQQ